MYSFAANVPTLVLDCIVSVSATKLFHWRGENKTRSREKNVERAEEGWGRVGGRKGKTRRGKKRREEKKERKKVTTKADPGGKRPSVSTLDLRERTASFFFGSKKNKDFGTKKSLRKNG